jgi:uncharacterized protein (DUF302 family)
MEGEGTMDHSRQSVVFPAVVFFVLLSTSGAGTLAQMHAPAFQTVVPSSYGFDDTVAMLKGAIEGENLMVINEIDPQKMLRMVGVKTRGIRQVFFFHPRFMKRLMDINPHATIEPPLKVAVMETPQGTAFVKYLKPSYLFGRYEGADAIGKELDALLAKIVAHIQQ